MQRCNGSLQDERMTALHLNFHPCINVTLLAGEIDPR